MLIKTFDPRSGELTPDESLFQPPVDYAVVEEKEDFFAVVGFSCRQVFVVALR